MERNYLIEMNEKLMKENSDEEIEKLNDKVKKLEEQIKGLIN